jgi:23S rRNA pseudouridine2605 synthase
MAERLHKVLARCGVGSRRTCEEIMRAWRVQGNGEKITEPGAKVDLATDDILLDGRPVREPETVVYMLNKPKGVVCSNRAQGDRKRAVDLVPHDVGHLYTVGRLDVESEGLILITNDGDLCNQITHPKHGVPKTYRVVVKGEVTAANSEQIQGGIYLAEGKTAPVRIRFKRRHRSTTVMDVTLYEGKNREVRRIFARFGHRVQHLKRIKIGPLSLGKLAPSVYRKLTEHEVKRLKKAIQKKDFNAPKKSGSKSRPEKTRTARTEKLAGRKTRSAAESRDERDRKRKSRDEPRSRRGRKRDDVPSAGKGKRSKAERSSGPGRKVKDEPRSERSRKPKSGAGTRKKSGAPKTSRGRKSSTRKQKAS